ncbi:MAG: S8 family peptidase [Chloroflexi bacterium]|nr:S8 family peptidase [Chloroflexota bacterium]
MKYRILALVSMMVLLAITPTFAQGPDKFKATPLSPISVQGGAKSVQPQSLQPNAQNAVNVIVKLKGEALADYRGSVPGLPATSPSVTGAARLDTESPNSKSYLNYLSKKHSDLEKNLAKFVPEAKTGQRFDVVLNAVSVRVPADKVKALAAMPDVEAVYPDELLKLDTENSPQFIGATAIWNQLGGQQNAGENVIVGVLDTGIWPEHPSFSNPDPAGKAYGAPPPPPSNVPRQCKFTGGANPGPAFTCNNKLIGAYRFMSTYEAVIGLNPGEYTTARDDDGHGTHTSSTAAGNGKVEASIFGIPRGTISGIAPRARVIMYKVCGAQGCFSSDSAAAVQQAIKDGVNVINFSISGGTNPYADAVEQAFLQAYSAGVFVAASAGNAGPTAETVAHRGPWVTTVAASTENRAFQNTATITADGGASLVLKGTSITKGVGPAAIFVPPTDVRCDTPFAAGSVAGKVVVCQRGNTGRAQKGYNVLQGGAVGMILYNQSTAVTDVETDNHYLPTTHIQFTDGQALLSFIGSHANVKATLTQGAKVSAKGDVMASFSSRGGPAQTIGISKPDITAPGVQILAGASPQHLSPANGGVALGPQGELFQAIAGTSMSSPHIAGAGALIKALHPNWTPGQIKSALMTTAWTQVVKEDGTTPANAFDDGSGRVDLNVAGDPGLTFDVSAADYVAHAADLWNVNYPSVYVPVMPGVITVQRTAKSLLGSDSHWKLKVVAPADVKIKVPDELEVKPGGSKTFDITVDARDVPLGQTRFATLYLDQNEGKNKRSLHIPITIVRKQPIVNLTSSCNPASFPKDGTSNCVITFNNTSFSNANVEVNNKLPEQLKLVKGSVVGGTSNDENKISFKGTLQGQQPPNVQIGTTTTTPAGGYLPLSAFGITPIAGMGDETIANFNVPAFSFGGESFTRVGVVSNGYVIVGGGTSADVQFINQNLPNATPPNNVLAPFWTDLNPAFGGAIRIGTLTDGVNTWLVVDFAGVREYSAAKTDTFEVWIRLGTTEDVTFVYGTLQGNGDAGFLTVGAENRFGNRGQNYYYNGTGTLPTTTTQLRVTTTPGTPGETRTIKFSVKGEKTGAWVNYTELTSNLFQGINIARFAGSVTK